MISSKNTGKRNNLSLPFQFDTCLVSPSFSTKDKGYIQLFFLPPIHLFSPWQHLITLSFQCPLSFLPVYSIPSFSLLTLIQDKPSLNLFHLRNTDLTHNYHLNAHRFLLPRTLALVHYRNCKMNSLSQGPSLESVQTPIHNSESILRSSSPQPVSHLQCSQVCYLSFNNILPSAPKFGFYSCILFLRHSFAFSWKSPIFPWAYTALLISFTTYIQPPALPIS